MALQLQQLIALPIGRVLVVAVITATLTVFPAHPLGL